MTAPYRKKLIEVALPLKAINEAAAREKGNPFLRGHPRSLHQWWARRPLTACRAVLFSSIVDDPDSDPAYRRSDGSVDFERAAIKRAELFNLIEALVQWENSNDTDVLRSARAEIARCVVSRHIEIGKLNADDEIIDNWTAGRIVSHCHARPKSGGVDKTSGRKSWYFDVAHLPPMPALLHLLATYAPPVLDPFCGGGSIPFEAQRLGFQTYGSDLNPVSVLITKALIEIPAKFSGRQPVNPDWQRKSREEKAAFTWQDAQGLADDVRYYSQWMRRQADQRIGHIYPKARISKTLADARPDLKEYVDQELPVTAWLWARTVVSSNPAFSDVPVPLVRAFWLCKKKGKQAWIEPVVDRRNKSYRFEVKTGTATAIERKAIEAGTKLGRGCKFRCLLSDEPIPEDHIKRAASENELGQVLLAVVAEGIRGKVYLPPSAVVEEPVSRPSDTRGIDAPLATDPRNLWCLGYGYDSFDKLFTDRQLVALTTYSDLVAEARQQVLRDAIASGGEDDGKPLIDDGLAAQAYSDAVATYLAMGVDKEADYSNNLCAWNSGNENIGHLFTKQAIPMTWDFVEANTLYGGMAFDNTVSGIASVLEAYPLAAGGLVVQNDSTLSLPTKEPVIIATDPPYYDNIAYSDLSDFFYVWLRRSLGHVYSSLLSTVVTPKAKELIASPYRHDGDKVAAKDFFEQGFEKAFGQMRNAQTQECPLTVFYAFKQTETDDGEGFEDQDIGPDIATASTGWETMLSGLIQTGFGIHGTWPMRTERATRSVGQGTNALASSIVLVCRPRPGTAAPTTRKDLIQSMRSELPTALRDLQQSNIAPVDLAQSAIGPGMAIFTRYSKVMESDGSTMNVRTALGLINQVLDEVLAEQEGEFDVDTRWAVSWFDQFGLEEGRFGEADVLARAKNSAVNGLVEAGIVVARSGKVRLLRRDEMPDDWDPATDKRLTVWEMTQHLIRVLQNDGELAAAELVQKLGSQAEIARDLAYRLYAVCERKKWADEALAYNSLVVVWPELVRLSLSSPPSSRKAQAELFS